MIENEVRKIIVNLLKKREDMKVICKGIKPGNSKLSNSFKALNWIVNPPLVPEIDIAYLQKNPNLEFTDQDLLVGIELKYFRENNKINKHPYYNGFSQALAYYIFGFDIVGVWHVYDENFSPHDLFNYAIHTWIYFKYMFKLPLEFTAFQIKMNNDETYVNIIQPGIDDQTFQPTKRIDDNGFTFTYSCYRPLSYNPQNASIQENNRELLLNYINEHKS